MPFTVLVETSDLYKLFVEQSFNRYIICKTGNLVTGNEIQKVLFKIHKDTLSITMETDCKNVKIESKLKV